MPTVLIIAELDRGQLKAATLASIRCAQRVCQFDGSSFHILVAGQQLSACVEALQGFGAASILTAEHPSLQEPLAERWAPVVQDAVRRVNAGLVVATASTFSKDLLPRAAALMDASMASDVVDVLNGPQGLHFKRVMHAGNAIATLQLDGAIRCITVRAAAFPSPVHNSAPSAVTALGLDYGVIPCSSVVVSREERASGRPDATEARIVVSGGRALKDAQDFERLVGGLADCLGAAVGSSRALVDAGITRNSLQIGQTGKVVAPDLYIAVGISGAIQHMAGMKDTKVIVAINKDPDAPIFEVADYGLVADVYQAVPEMIDTLRKK